MQPQTFYKNDTIIRYGDEGNQYFFLAKGSVKVVVYEDGTDPNDDNLEDHRVMIKYICAGQGFGELSILNEQPRSASIIAVDEKCELYSLSGELFKAIIYQTNYERKTKLAAALNKIPLFDMYDNFFKLQLTENIKEVTYEQNEFIINEGEDSHAFYIILEGAVECLKYYEDEQKKGNIRVRDLRQHEHFGEVGVLENKKRSMSVRATTRQCTLVKFPKEILSRMIFSIEGKLKRDYSRVFDNQL